MPELFNWLSDSASDRALESYCREAPLSKDSGAFFGEESNDVSHPDPAATQAGTTTGGARLGLRPAVAAVGYRRCPAPTRQSAD